MSHGFKLGSERESPLPDRELGLQDLREKNAECEHVVVVGAGEGAATLALKMRGQDVCPHCTRREAAYWRVRAKTAEGMLAATHSKKRVAQHGNWDDADEAEREADALTRPAPRPPREP